VSAPIGDPEAKGLPMNPNQSGTIDLGTFGSTEHTLSDPRFLPCLAIDPEFLSDFSH
jgi:hypothetical protein